MAVIIDRGGEPVAGQRYEAEVRGPDGSLAWTGVFFGYEPPLQPGYTYTGRYRELGGTPVVGPGAGPVTSPPVTGPYYPSLPGPSLPIGPRAPVIVPSPMPTPVLPIGGAIVVTLSVLVGRFGSFTGKIVYWILRRMAQGGGQVLWAQWQRLPMWVRQGLGILGIAEGGPLVIDLLDGDPDINDALAVEPDEALKALVQALKSGAAVAVGGAPMGVAVVKAWVANGVQMVRFSDGRMGAWSVKRGVWKIWRPRKPIVIFSNGARDLPTLLRADAAIGRQVAKLNKAINRRRLRGPKGPKGDTVVMESGPGGVYVRK